MSQIWIAAVITTILIFFIVGGILLKIIDISKYKKEMIFIFLLNLLLPASLYYLVRLPLDSLINRWLATYPEVLFWVKSIYAPITEEPGKALILLFPFCLKFLNKSTIQGAAIAAGMGFGIGEAWLLAHLYAGNPVFNSYQWYEYTGFISERFTVAIIHGSFIGLTIYFTVVKRKFLLGISLAMLSHFALNFPILLFSSHGIPLQTITRQILLMSWSTVFFALSLVFLIWLGNKPNISLLGKLRKALGKATCPKCNATYDRPILGINLLTKRLEKCPNCKKWVIT
jgi:RsiW-degrading membrane proteinase PrsW (M82 family)